MSTKSIQLAEQRAALIGEARKVLDSTELPHDERQGKFDAMMLDVDKMYEDICTLQRSEHLEKVEGELKLSAKEVRSAPHRMATSPVNEYRAFNAWLKNKSGVGVTGEDLAACERFYNPYAKEITVPFVDGSSMRAIEATNNQGTLIPTLIVSEVERWLKYYSQLRQVCNVKVTPTGDPFNWPVMDFTSISTGITAEDSSIPENDPTITKVPFSAYAFKQLVQLTTEMLQDNIFGSGLVSYIASGLGEAIGRGQSVYFETGDGSSVPQGLVTYATANGVQSGGTVSSLTMDLVLNAIYAIDRAYVKEAEFFVSNSTMGTLRTLKDSEGRYFLSNYINPVTNAPEERIDGHRVNILSSISNYSASGHNTFLVFCPPRLFTIRDVIGMTLSVNPYENERDGLVNVYGQLRSDSNYIGPPRSLVYMTT